MVIHKPFLTPDEARGFKERLFENRDHGFRTILDHVFGAGIDFSFLLPPDHTERIRQHNQFMRTVFPDLLETLRLYFESQLGKKCYFSEDLSYPGFHIFRIPSGKVRSLWFHCDDTRAILKENYSWLDADENSRQFTYTVLLDSPQGLTAGLLYFPEKNLGLKVMKMEISRHGEFVKNATLHEYKCGEMNFYETLVHSVYGRNDSESDVDRVTLQGHIVETKNGYVLYR